MSDKVLEFQPGDYEIVEDAAELSPNELELIPYVLPVTTAAERTAAMVAQDGPRLEL